MKQILSWKGHYKYSMLLCRDKTQAKQASKDGYVHFEILKLNLGEMTYK